MVSWQVDDRPPTLWARAYVLGMRASRDKQAFEGEQNTRRTAEKRQRKGNAAPSLLTRRTHRVATRTIADTTVWVAAPRGRRPAVRVVYVHGGGYVHPLTSDYWRLVRALADAPAEVVVPVYPLAPGATVDDVLPRLVEIAAGTLADPGVPTVLMGDSAGGALVLAIAQRLRDTGRDLPAAVVALCPWLDATLEEDAVRDLDSSDPMLAESGLRAAGRWWAGRRRPADPLVSPVNADLAGLPPMHVFIGDRDILRPAVDEFAARAEAAGADLRVHEVPAMFHVWMTRAIPEGRRTRRQLVGLLREVAGQADR